MQLQLLFPPRRSGGAPVAQRAVCGGQRVHSGSAAAAAA